MSGSFGSPFAVIVIESGVGVPGPLGLVVLVVVVLARNGVPPPAFALFGKVLLIKGLSAAAPP
jgi:hypothetical protein